MKFFKYILFLVIFLNLDIIVNAGVNHGFSQAYENECVSDKSCMLVCGYTNKVRYTHESVAAQYDYFSSYIYYNINEKSFFVEWLSQETDLNLATHTYNIGKKYIFFQESALNDLVQNGKCPTDSFIDVNGMGLASEVCFTNSTSYCTEEKNNIGTTFKGTSTKDYDYQNSINTYFDNWSPNLDSYTCDDLKNKNIDYESQFVEDFSKNFLYGEAIPSFINNSQPYLNGLKKLESNIDNILIKCNQEDNEKYENGEITLEEYEENIKKNEEGADYLDEELKDAAEKIEIGTNNSDVEIEDIGNCESLLGSPDAKDPASPAYYMSFAFSIIRYVAIILLIVLTMMDFVSAVASQDNDILKKAATKAVQRAILCVIIFILPTLIDFVLQFIHDASISDCISLDS